VVGSAGPYASGESVTASHTWTAAGRYDIRVKARDSFGAESDWSEPLTVKMLTITIRKQLSVTNHQLRETI